MAQHVIETVTFRVEDGISKEAFLKAAEMSTAFVTAQPGFVRRRLSCTEDGLWIEHIEWESMADAKAAAAAIGKTESVRPFVGAIHGPSVTLMHSILEVSVG